MMQSYIDTKLYIDFMQFISNKKLYDYVTIKDPFYQSHA